MTQTAIGILFLVFFLSLVAIAKIYKRIRYASKDLDTLDRILSHPAPTWDCIMTSGVRSNWVNERIIRLNALFEQNERPDILILRDESESRFENHIANRILQFSSSSLLIIGLCGTFLASREILLRSGLDCVVSDEAIDMVRFRESIDTIYIGFKYAFLASVFGIVFTVAISAANIWIQRNWKVFLERFDSMTSTVIIPRFSRRDRSDSGEFRDAAELIRDSSVTLDRVSNEVSSTSLEFTKSIDSTVQRMSDAAEVLQTVTAEESPLLQTLAALTLLQKAFMDERKSHDQHLNQLVVQIQGLATNLAGAQTEFVKLNSSLSDLHLGFPQQIAGMITEYKDSITRLVDKSIQFIKDEALKIDQQRTGELQLMNGTKALLGRIETSQSGVESRIKTAIDPLSDSIRNLQTGVGELPDALKNAARGITLTPVQIPAAPAIDKDGLNDAISKLTTTAERIGRVVERLDHSLQALRIPVASPHGSHRTGLMSMVLGWMGRRSSR